MHSVLIPQEAPQVMAPVDPIPFTGKDIIHFLFRSLLLQDYSGDGVIFRHVSDIVVETPESFPWTLDGEYGPGEELVEIHNLRQKLTFLL